MPLFTLRSSPASRYAWCSGPATRNFPLTAISSLMPASRNICRPKTSPSSREWLFIPLSEWLIKSEQGHPFFKKVIWNHSV